jgi:hypothetical protein
VRKTPRGKFVPPASTQQPATVDRHAEILASKASNGTAYASSLEDIVT